MRETLKQNFMSTDLQIKHLSSSPIVAFTATTDSNGGVVDNESGAANSLGATRKQNRRIERTDLGRDYVRENSRQTSPEGAFSCGTGSTDKSGKTEHHRPKLVSARLSRPSETVRHPAGATASGSNGSDSDAIFTVDPSFSGDSSDEGGDPSWNSANDLSKAQGNAVFCLKVSSPRPSDDVQRYGLREVDLAQDQDDPLQLNEPNGPIGPNQISEFSKLFCPTLIAESNKQNDADFFHKLNNQFGPNFM
ncbi:uncharacterized protein LOC21389499 [Morus notabilis]|uniref:uncharacterized protein LOC21389499 n=1 Tax=Morus notabilis TaxID=981085 RepID=UPI000CECF595|nr:uncharacterized protein LOC21389499 [Morus notabilis]